MIGKPQPPKEAPMSHTPQSPPLPNRRVARRPSRVRLDPRFLRLPLWLRILSLSITKAR